MSRFILTSSRINYKRRSAPSHSNTTLKQSQVFLLRRPLPSLSATFYMSIASTARIVLAKVGLQNLCTLKILLGIAGNRIFGKRLHATAHLLLERLRPLLFGGQMSTSSTFWWPNVYIPLYPGGCICVPQVNIKIVSTKLLPDSHLRCND